MHTWLRLTTSHWEWGGYVFLVKTQGKKKISPWRDIFFLFFSNFHGRIAPYFDMIPKISLFWMMLVMRYSLLGSV